MSFINRICYEPPFRMAAKAAIMMFSHSIRTKALWDAVDRPNYLNGVLTAADQAKREGKDAISVFEFGVAGGAGLLALQGYAAAVEKETGVTIYVYGFDHGRGLPELCGDYRDHPDQWKQGDYWMDEPALRRRLTQRSSLILGNVRDTLPEFLSSGQLKAPVGFVSMDVDLYSSTMSALRLFTAPGSRMLRRVTMYFDDVNFFFNHRFAGELLAIDEFNASQSRVKIDVWRGLVKNRPFPEASWLPNMYVAHDLEAISATVLEREPALLKLEEVSA
jgi:hypothetical protein